MPSTPIPSYKNPPVVETVLGVEFAQIAGWGVHHFGLFARAIRDEFPSVELQPALASGIESFEPPKLPEARIELIDHPNVRLWYISEDSHQLVQVQLDRFIFNWRKGDADMEYPRFDDFVRPGFERAWARFAEFLVDEGLERPNVLQCEVTYVNHIPRGDGWDSVSDWHSVLRPLASSAGQVFLPSPEAARVHLQYVIPENRGRLRVSANHAIRAYDGKQIIHMQLTARGKPISTSDEAIVDSLRLGREWVVRGFTDLTTDKMHQIWQREQ